MQPSRKSSLRTYEEAVEEALRWVPKHLATYPDVVEHVRADVRLQYDYPNEYVAYIDTRKGRGKKRQFMRRLLAHNKDQKPVSDVVSALTVEERAKVMMRYISDPRDETVECPSVLEVTEVKE